MFCEVHFVFSWLLWVNIKDWKESSLLQAEVQRVHMNKERVEGDIAWETPWCLQREREMDRRSKEVQSRKWKENPFIQSLSLPFHSTLWVLVLEWSNTGILVPLPSLSFSFSVTSSSSLMFLVFKCQKQYWTGRLHNEKKHTSFQIKDNKRRRWHRVARMRQKGLDVKEMKEQAFGNEKIQNETQGRQDFPAYIQWKWACRQLSFVVALIKKSFPGLHLNAYPWTVLLGNEKRPSFPRILIMMYFVLWWWSLFFSASKKMSREKTVAWTTLWAPDDVSGSKGEKEREREKMKRKERKVFTFCQSRRTLQPLQLQRNCWDIYLALLLFFISSIHWKWKGNEFVFYVQCSCRRITGRLTGW